MTDEMKRDIEWLRSLKDNGRFSRLGGDAAIAGFTFDARIDRIVAALSAPSSPGDGWEPIETAPRDGTAILAAHYHAQFVVVWSDECGGWTDGHWDREWGEFITLGPTAWKPLGPLPAAPSPGGDHDA